MDNSIVFGDTDQNKTDKNSKKNIKNLIYILLGASVVYLLIQVVPNFIKNYNKDKKNVETSNDINNNNKSSVATVNNKKKSAAASSSYKKSSKNNNVNEKNIASLSGDDIDLKTQDLKEEQSSIVDMGPVSGYEAADVAIEDGFEGTTLDEAFKPFTNGGDERPKTKIVFAKSFYDKPHKNENGLPAVTKQQLQEQKLRSLTKYSKQDRPDSNDKYVANMFRPLPDRKDRGTVNYPFAKTEKEVQYDPNLAVIDDSKLDYFGKAYES